MNQNNTTPKTDPDKDQKGQPGQDKIRPDADRDQTRQGGRKDQDDAQRR